MCNFVQLYKAGFVWAFQYMATQMEKDIKLIVQPKVMQLCHTLLTLVLFHTCMTDFLSSKGEKVKVNIMSTFLPFNESELGLALSSSK